MKKARIYLILIIPMVFIISVDMAHAFEIEAVLTTSKIVDGMPQGKEIYFEPGDFVWIYVCTKNHREDEMMRINVKSVLYDPLGQIKEEITFELLNPEYERTVPTILWRDYLPSQASFEYESNVLPIYWIHYLPSWMLSGKYTIRVTIYDRNDDTQKTEELSIYVGCYEAHEHLRKADSYFTEGRYKEAKTFYKLAKDKYTRFGVVDETYHCSEKMEECEKYIEAEKYLSIAEACLIEKNYSDAVYYFIKARDSYKELGDENSVQICSSQISEYTGRQLYIKMLLEIPSIANLSLMTWVIYFFIREFRTKEKKELLVIFVLIVLIVFTNYFIGFYFYDFLYATLFLAAITGGALMLKLILLKKYRKKVYPNPYIAGNPIRSKEIFFGRKDVFQFVRKKLSTQENNITIVLYGERRTGKTSVLYQIESGELGKEFVPVYIDIQEMARVNEPEFFIKITEKVIESLTRNEIMNPRSSIYSEITALLNEFKIKQNSYLVFNEFLDRVSCLLGEKYLILMFDEYEILERKIEERHLNPDLIRYLRSQMQSREKFSFIFAGSKKLEELKGKHWGLMFNAATYKKIRFLKKEDALDLMTIPVENRIHYTDEAVDKILRLTACHPYFLQLFLQNLVDHLNDINNNRVVIEEIEYVLHYLVENPSPHMIYIWQDSRVHQKTILSILSEIIYSDKEYIPLEKIKDRLSTSGLDMDIDSIKKILDGLYQKEILNCAENGYNFKIDLMRYWVKTEHPLFKTMEEIK